MILPFGHPPAGMGERPITTCGLACADPGAPAGCSRCERSLDKRFACAASSRVVWPTCVPLPLWPRYAACGGNDVDIDGGIRDRTRIRGRESGDRRDVPQRSAVFSELGNEGKAELPGIGCGLGGAASLSRGE